MLWAFINVKLCHLGEYNLIGGTKWSQTASKINQPFSSSIWLTIYFYFKEVTFYMSEYFLCKNTIYGIIRFTLLKMFFNTSYTVYLTLVSFSSTLQLTATSFSQSQYFFYSTLMNMDQNQLQLALTSNVRFNIEKWTLKNHTLKIQTMKV